MVRRLGAGLFLLITVSGLTAVSSTAEAADALVVPSDLHGSSAVTANVSADEAPYLELTLGQGYPTPPHAPVAANTGPGTMIPVDTWGFSGSTTLSLVGCSTSDPATCTTPIATTSVVITQVDAATGEIDAPDAPFLYPEDQVEVTAHNAGGGVMRAVVTGAPDGYMGSTTLRQIVPPDSTVALDLSGVINPGNGSTVLVQRCSSYDTGHCEPAVATTTTHFLSRVAVYTVRTGSPTPFYTDPRLDNTEVSFLDYGPLDPSAAFDASWSLEDTHGATVIAPVAVGAATGGHLVPFAVDLAHQGAAGLTGDYVLSVTNTVQTPYGPRTGTETRPVTLVLDPPVTTPTGTVLDDAVRLIGPTYIDNAAFAVPAIDPGVGPGELIVRNADGKVVFRDDQPSVDGTYRWSWDGYRAGGGPPVPSGTYRASATIPDHYGRRLDVDLGQVRVYYWLDDDGRRVHTPVSARLAGVARGPVSRTFHLRLPSRPGRIEHLEPSVHCAAMPGRPAHIELAVRVPEISRRWTTERRPLSCADRAGWQPGPGWTARDDTVGTRTAGLRVDVRVTVQHRNAAIVSGLRTEYTSWHWAL